VTLGNPDAFPSKHPASSQAFSPQILNARAPTHTERRFYETGIFGYLPGNSDMLPRKSFPFVFRNMFTSHGTQLTQITYEHDAGKQCCRGSEQHAESVVYWHYRGIDHPQLLREAHKGSRMKDNEQRHRCGLSFLRNRHHTYASGTWRYWGDRPS